MGRAWRATAGLYVSSLQKGRPRPGTRRRESLPRRAQRPHPTAERKELLSAHKQTFLLTRRRLPHLLHSFSVSHFHWLAVQLLLRDTGVRPRRGVSCIDSLLTARAVSKPLKLRDPATHRWQCRSSTFEGEWSSLKRAFGNTLQVDLRTSVAVSTPSMEVYASKYT
jgi:hypothetical protein